MNKYPGYFVGQIAELDKKQNIKQEGHGVRYRVRRFGIDSENTPPDKLLMFDTILPPTDGAGDGLRARSVNFAVGDMVFGLHLDAPQNQKGIILGVFPRTSLIQYNKYVKTEDQTTASGGDQGGERTMPTKPNVKAAQPPGSSNTADTKAEKDAIKEVKEGTGATDPTKVDDPLAFKEFTGDEVSPTSSGGGSPRSTSSRSTDQTAADVLNRDPQSISQYGTRINNTPTAEQLEQFKSSGLTFTPNADGSPGGKVENPNSLLGG